MTVQSVPGRQRDVIGREGLQRLIEHLLGIDYQVLGPRLVDGVITIAPIAGINDLPAGWEDEQDCGHYRLVQKGNHRMFGYGPGPQGWKRFLYPPVERLWRAHRCGSGFEVDDEAPDAPRYAFLGVRACDLAAIKVQDIVFGRDGSVDPGYRQRRAEAFIIAVNCTRASGTCFCASMGAGPRVQGDFDLLLTEVVEAQPTEFLVEVGSERGAEVLDQVERRTATSEEGRAAEMAVVETVATMGREMISDVAALLKDSLDHRHWREVAERCLACGNCTMVCPTCFCSTVEDVTDLSGAVAERWRKWDSCFTIDFSYIHGGSIRREGASRYRQWMTHKLATWHEQFGASGCVGCGRCITWCPVGIDITAEARAIRDSEGVG